MQIGKSEDAAGVAGKGEKRTLRHTSAALPSTSLRLPFGCPSAALRLHFGCTSAALRLHFGCTSAALSASAQGKSSVQDFD